MERLVGFLVVFHRMAKRVQDFWPRVTFGIFGYDMSRSQSIMRVATTACPVAGSDVRDKARHYHHNNSVHTWHLRTYPRRMQMFELAEVTTREQASSVLRRRWLQKYLGVGIRRRASRRFMIMISAISYHTRWVLTRLTADDGPHSLEIRRVSCDVTWP